MKRTIVLTSNVGFTWRLEMEVQDGGGGAIVNSTLLDCIGDDPPDEDFVEGMERMILAHACAGVDVESAAYIEGIDTAVDNRTGG